jgi:predicted esterase
MGGHFRAVIALSGALVGTGDADGPPEAALYGYPPKRLDYTRPLDGVPAYLGVHERDPHIPLKRVKESAAVLAGRGATVELDVYRGAGHGVMPAGLEAMRAAFAA